MKKSKKFVLAALALLAITGLLALAGCKNDSVPPEVEKQEQGDGGGSEDSGGPSAHTLQKGLQSLSLEGSRPQAGQGLGLLLRLSSRRIWAYPLGGVLAMPQRWPDLCPDGEQRSLIKDLHLTQSPHSSLASLPITQTALCPEGSVQ